MICFIAIILIPTLEAMPLNNETTTTPPTTNTTTLVPVENKTQTVETTYKKNNISRIDYHIKDVIPAEVAIAFVKTNGTTYGDTFANPFETKLDLPVPKNIQKALEMHPEFKNLKGDKEFTQLVEEFARSKNLEMSSQEENKYGHVQKVNIGQGGSHLEPLRSFEGRNFKPSKEEDNPETFKPINPNFFDDLNGKDYFIDDSAPYQTPNYEEEIQKHIYVHVPPEESHELPQKQYQPPTIKKEKHYKIVFIKAPSPNLPQIQQPQTIVQKEEKTLIYVLVKKPDVSRLFKPTTISPVDTTMPSKPEVYYISYKPKRERIEKNNNAYLPIPSTLDDRNGVYENDRKDDLDNVEVKSNLDDVTV